MCNFKEKFSNLNNEQIQIYTATEEKVKSTGRGQIKLKVNVAGEIKLKEAVLVPEFKNNLLSVSSIAKNGYKVIFQKNSAVVKRPDGSTALKARQENGLYIVKEMKNQAAVSLNKDEENIVKWHERFGHLNCSDVRKLKDNNMVIGINDRLNKIDRVCEVCEKSKIHQLPYKTSERREKEILGLVHSDICGPISTTSLGGAKYFVTFIDNKSRFIEIKPLKKKSDVLEAFKEYKARVEKTTGHCIKKLRIDNAKEYLSKEFNDFLKKEGIARQLTVEYTPQQNDVAERANRTLVEMARCMLLQANAPFTLWAEAINASAHIRNRCLTRILNDVTYEEWTGEKPYVGYMRKFGSKVIALKKTHRDNKFSPKGEEYILVGYSQESKAYRLWIRGTKTVVKRKDVQFIENQTIHSEGTELFDIPTNHVKTGRNGRRR